MRKLHTELPYYTYSLKFLYLNRTPSKPFILNSKRNDTKCNLPSNSERVTVLQCRWHLSMAGILSAPLPPNPNARLTSRAVQSDTPATHAADGCLGNLEEYADCLIISHNYDECRASAWGFF
ncbi:hypothetical protein CDAR_602301 [Caerostris darwini]|uniref:Uncharacterized protein n=1 Tax=Caerostris darwini TaxID=1538125 RepID=A0AAV4NA45_9ARAC|nr:hypothetical protein CDAR_602301 [Caerostris darwini]